jgi:hypothetical protein
MEWIGNSEIDSKNPTLKAFYPTTDLVTGPDIIFFWVARMIMAGYEYMGDLPFRNVYYTGIIRDKQGRKMSKSLGNSPDPLDLITRYGADALRFGVMRAAPLGQDILFDEQNVELGRNFCNKLWNACRFRQMQGGEAQGEIDVNKLRADDKWILLKLHAAIKELDTAFAEYRFSDATQTLYRFFYNEYCDWYVESCKAVLQSGGSGRESAQTPPEEDQSRLTSAATDPKKANVVAVMDFVLSHTLRLFHPFLPFITEELWHGMGYAEDMPEGQGGRSIMHAPWPKPFDADFALEVSHHDKVGRRSHRRAKSADRRCPGDAQKQRDRKHRLAVIRADDRGRDGNRNGRQHQGRRRVGDPHRQQRSRHHETEDQRAGPSARPGHDVERHAGMQVPSLHGTGDDKTAHEQHDRLVGVGRGCLLECHHACHRQDDHWQQRRDRDRHCLRHPPRHHKHGERDHPPGLGRQALRPRRKLHQSRKNDAGDYEYRAERHTGAHGAAWGRIRHAVFSPLAAAGFIPTGWRCFPRGQAKSEHLARL